MLSAVTITGAAFNKVDGRQNLKYSNNTVELNYMSFVIIHLESVT